MYTLENAPLTPDTLESLKLIVGSIQFSGQEVPPETIHEFVLLALGEMSQEEVLARFNDRIKAGAAD
ncbi:MAG: hypothetical protein Q4A82_07185 [Corynebacterium sp.]|nr:hypothetical protein [Corynebacterium sp.]